MTEGADQSEAAQAGPRRKPLARFTVLDLTRVRSGPNAVRQLADWGANVIKIEAPAEDDMTGSRSGYDFQSLHRNKRSVVLDLKLPAGLDAFYRLVRQADVLVENFRPDVKHRLKIDYASLATINPRLVYGSISGFGQDGPYARRPGFDQIAQGMGGVMSLNGEQGQGPLRVGIPVADIASGLFCAIGILTALLDRETSGRGQWIETSLLRAQIALLDFQAASWLIDRKIPGQTGNHHPYMTPMGVFPAADGNLVIGASGEAQYRRLCDALEASELHEDPRFATVAGRAANVEAFIEALGRITRTGTVSHWVERLNAAGIACGPINSIDRVFQDPQVRHLNLVRQVQHPELGPLDLVGSAFTLSESESAIETPSPTKGAHTEAVMAEAGMAPEEIAALRMQGVLG